MKNLSGGTAVLTGASRGIGVHIARALANEGMNLVLAARSVEGLERVATEMEGLGVRALAVPTDVADAAARKALIDTAIAEFGSIDLLVNNAGIETAVKFHEQDPAEIEHAIAVNLTALMMLTQLVLPGMLERKRGHIVNMASLAGKAGTGFEAVYSTTKHGIMGFTRSLRQEYHRSGVGISAICPGFVSDTGMYADAMLPAGVKASRLVGTSKPEKVARAVLKAIKKDKPEIIVNPNAVRVLLTIAEASPSLGERMVRALGANDVFKRTAEYNAAERDSVASQPAEEPAASATSPGG